MTTVKAISSMPEDKSTENARLGEYLRRIDKLVEKQHHAFRGRLEAMRRSVAALSPSDPDESGEEAGPPLPLPIGSLPRVRDLLAPKDLQQFADAWMRCARFGETAFVFIGPNRDQPASPFNAVPITIERIKEKVRAPADKAATVERSLVLAIEDARNRTAEPAEIPAVRVLRFLLNGHPGGQDPPCEIEIST